MRSEDSCTFTVFLQRLCVSIEHPAALWLNAALTAKRWAPHAPLESRLKLFTRFIKSEIKAWRVGLQTGFISENSSLTEPFVGVIVGAIIDHFLLTSQPGGDQPEKDSSSKTAAMETWRSTERLLGGEQLKFTLWTGSRTVLQTQGSFLRRRH